MGTKLYVGNLSYGLSEDDLKNAFGAHGEVVDARIITDRYTGQSRGFGFVEMAEAEEAQLAIESLNGVDLGGRTIVVNEARPLEKRDRDSREGRRSGPPRGPY